jgi:hypothetical protein
VRSNEDLAALLLPKLAEAIAVFFEAYDKDDRAGENWGRRGIEQILNNWHSSGDNTIPYGCVPGRIGSIDVRLDPSVPPNVVEFRTQGGRVITRMRLS